MVPKKKAETTPTVALTRVLLLQGGEGVTKCSTHARPGVDRVPHHEPVTPPGLFFFALNDGVHENTCKTPENTSFYICIDLACAPHDLVKLKWLHRYSVALCVVVLFCVVLCCVVLCCVVLCCVVLCCVVLCCVMLFCVVLCCVVLCCVVLCCVVLCCAEGAVTKRQKAGMSTHG